MADDFQFFRFYSSLLAKTAKNIIAGKVTAIVGVNAMGKTYLFEEIQSRRFKTDYLKNGKIHLVFLSFKDQITPLPAQLYRYFLNQTEAVLGFKTNGKEEMNEFTFYTSMTNIIKNLKTGEILAFIVLDAQNILNMPESFFLSLTYLSIYSYGKTSFTFLAEPQVLEPVNAGAARFFQRFVANNFHFLKPFDRNIMLTDIRLQSELFKTDFMSYTPLLLRHSKGWHGILRTSCTLIKNHPEIRNKQGLYKAIYNDKLCRFWANQVLDSLPPASLKILKEISLTKSKSEKYKKSIYFRWLVNLSFVKTSGALRYPIILPFLKDYQPRGMNKNIPIRFAKNGLFLHGQITSLPKKEAAILKLLYRNKNKLVSYDTIGEVLWKDDPDKYSLWAISQIVRRIRKSLAGNFINPKIISSQRSKGYILN